MLGVIDNMDSFAYVQQTFPRSISLLAELADSRGCMIYKGDSSQSNVDIYLPAIPGSPERITNILSVCGAQWDNFILDKIQDLCKYNAAIISQRTFWALAKLLQPYVYDDQSIGDLCNDIYEHLTATIRKLHDRHQASHELVDLYIRAFCTQCSETWQDLKRRVSTSKVQEIIWKFTVSTDPTKPPADGFYRYVHTTVITLRSDLGILLKGLRGILNELERAKASRGKKKESVLRNTSRVEDVQSKFKEIKTRWPNQVNVTANDRRKSRGRKSGRRRVEVGKDGQPLGLGLLSGCVVDLLLARHTNHTRDCMTDFVAYKFDLKRLASHCNCYGESVQIYGHGKLPSGHLFRIMLVSNTSSIFKNLPEFKTMPKSWRYIGGFAASELGHHDVVYLEPIYKQLGLPDGEKHLPDWWEDVFGRGELEASNYALGKEAEAAPSCEESRLRLSQWVRQVGKGRKDILTKEEAKRSRHLETELASFFSDCLPEISIR
jgi:hypothetical protein